VPKYPASPEDIAARKALGTLLMEIRTGAGLSQADLAERCGKQQMWASRIETGQAGVEPHEVIAWCRACGTHAEMVIGDDARSPEAVYLADRPPRLRRMLLQIARAMEAGGEWAIGRFEKEIENVQERLVFNAPDENQDRARG
jgi:transcriptional regulator with XRE-family HTH domain